MTPSFRFLFRADSKLKHEAWQRLYWIAAAGWPAVSAFFSAFFLLWCFLALGAAAAGAAVSAAGAAVVAGAMVAVAGAFGASAAKAAVAAKAVASRAVNSFIFMPFGE
ncbi:MAG: hypothetical protein KUL81_15145 [Azonexus sp.]|nr:hypothetical protein [Azonexus sp.]